MKNKIAFFVSFLFCLTYPGIQDIAIIYLNEYFVKFFALFILLLQIKNFNVFFKFFHNRLFAFLILFLFLFKTFKNVDISYVDFKPFLNLVWIFLIFITIKTKKQFDIFLKFIFFSSFIIICSAGVENIFDFNREFFKRSYTENNALVGFVQSYIIYSMCAFQCLFLSIYFYRSSNKFTRFFYLITIAISLTATFTSGSRAATFILIFSSLIYFFLNKRSNFFKDYFSKKAMFYFAILCFLSSYFIPYEYIFNEISNIFFGADRSANRRLSAMFISVESFYNHPLFGNGWGYTRSIVGIPTHSIFLQLIGELGLLGLALELSIHLLTFKLFMNLYNKFIMLSINAKFLLLSVSTMMFSFFIWSFFENLGYVNGDRIIYTNIVVLFLINKIYLPKKL